ncbi:hypothetical protein [Natronolimnobius baerhuensis]|uniref:DUF485 domain-containing protein n=1 Tax=Natronolimnobius baerhuensis TaxID=253108 RepID=A0A202ECM2_9EURY|nr:hypothetical protein [Natronolimnobius baerhuensis]OVE85967.1 hypothetical protein B2G88_03975 [Natronolimnobius baerhuensis]
MSTPSASDDPTESDDEPHWVSTGEALGYVTSEYRTLFAYLIIGWLVWLAGGSLFSEGTSSSPPALTISTYGAVLLVAGAGTMLAVLIATVYKLGRDIQLARD